MAKGLLGGMTDYSHQSFVDIVNDLESEQQNVTAFIDRIEQNLKALIDNGFWKAKVLSNFQLQIDYSIKYY